MLRVLNSRVIVVMICFIQMAMTIDGQAQIQNTAVPFLLIAPNARASGLGETGVAVADDANAMFWNPAGLGFQSGQEVSLNHTNWLPKFNQPDLYYEYGAYRIQVEDVGTIGASFTFLNLGEFQHTLSTGPDVVGTFRSWEMALALGYGAMVTDNLAFGINAKYIHSNLSNIGAGREEGQGVADAIAADIGLLYRPNRFVIPFTDIDFGNRIAFGMNFSNIGPHVFYVDENQKDPLPANLRLGFAFDFVKEEFNRLTWLVDVSKLMVNRKPYSEGGAADPLYKAIFTTWDKPIGEIIRDFSFATGFEYWYSNLVALRFGYYYEDPSIGNRNFITYGAGLRYDMYGFDFSYISSAPGSTEQHPLEGTLRFSLIVGWDKITGNTPDNSDAPVDDSSN